MWLRQARRNLLNSVFIHRHKNHTQAKEALQRATPEQLAVITKFSAGECWANIYGANALIRAQMRRSPFKLTKVEF